MFHHQSLRSSNPSPLRHGLPIALAGLTVCISLTVFPGTLLAQDDDPDGIVGPPPPRVTRIARPGAERLIADAMKRGRREGLEPVRLFFGTLAGIDRFSLDRVGVARILKDSGLSSNDTAGNLLRSFRTISKNGVNVSFRTDGDIVSLREPNGQVAGRLGLSQSGSYQVYWSGRRVIVNKLSGVKGGEGASGRLYTISKLILAPRSDGSTKATATGHLLFFSKNVTFYLSRPKPVPEPVLEVPEPAESVEASDDEGTDEREESPGIVTVLEAAVSSD